MIDLVLLNMASTSGFTPSANDTPSVEETVTVVREYDHTYPTWIDDFNKKCLHLIGTKCLKKLDKLMESFLMHIRRECDFRLPAPSKAFFLAKAMYRYITFFYLYYQDAKDFFVTSHYKENVVELLVIYCKLEVRSSQRGMRGKENDMMISNRILNLMWIILERNEKHMLHVLIKLTRDKFLTKRHKDMFSPIFRKMLTFTQPRTCTELEYIRYLLAFKGWKKCVYINEKKEISELALHTLRIPDTFEANYRLKYSKIFNIYEPHMAPSLHEHCVITYIEDLTGKIDAYFNIVDNNRNKSHLIDHVRLDKLSFLSEFVATFTTEEDDINDLTADMTESCTPLLNSIKKETEQIYDDEDDIIVIEDSPPTPKRNKNPVLVEFIDLTEDPEDTEDIKPPMWVQTIIPLAKEYTEELINTRKMEQEIVKAIQEELELNRDDSKLNIKKIEPLTPEKTKLETLEKSAEEPKKELFSPMLSLHGLDTIEEREKTEQPASKDKLTSGETLMNQQKSKDNEPLVTVDGPLGTENSSLVEAPTIIEETSGSETISIEKQTSPNIEKCEANQNVVDSLPSAEIIQSEKSTNVTENLEEKTSKQTEMDPKETPQEAAPFVPENQQEFRDNSNMYNQSDDSNESIVRKPTLKQIAEQMIMSNILSNYSYTECSQSSEDIDIFRDCQEQHQNSDNSDSGIESNSSVMKADSKINEITNDIKQCHINDNNNINTQITTDNITETDKGITNETLNVNTQDKEKQTDKDKNKDDNNESVISNTTESSEKTDSSIDTSSITDYEAPKDATVQNTNPDDENPHSNTENNNINTAITNLPLSQRLQQQALEELEDISRFIQVQMSQLANELIADNLSQEMKNNENKMKKILHDMQAKKEKFMKMVEKQNKIIQEASKSLTQKQINNLNTEETVDGIVKTKHKKSDETHLKIKKKKNEKSLVDNLDEITNDSQDSDNNVHLKSTSKLDCLIAPRKERKVHFYSVNDMREDENTHLSTKDTYESKISKKDECILKVYKKTATVEPLEETFDIEKSKRGYVIYKDKKSPEYIPGKIKRRNSKEHKRNSLERKSLEDEHPKRRFSFDSESITEEQHTNSKNNFSKKDFEYINNFEEITEDNEKPRRRNSLTIAHKKSSLENEETKKNQIRMSSIQDYDLKTYKTELKPFTQSQDNLTNKIIVKIPPTKVEISPENIVTDKRKRKERQKKEDTKKHDKKSLKHDENIEVNENSSEPVQNEVPHKRGKRKKDKLKTDHHENKKTQKKLRSKVSIITEIDNELDKLNDVEPDNQIFEDTNVDFTSSSDIIEDISKRKHKHEDREHKRSMHRHVPHRSSPKAEENTRKRHKSDDHKKHKYNHISQLEENERLSPSEEIAQTESYFDSELQKRLQPQIENSSEELNDYIHHSEVSDSLRNENTQYDINTHEKLSKADISETPPEIHKSDTLKEKNPHLSKKERRERKKQNHTTEKFKAVSMGNDVCKVRIIKENIEATNSFDEEICVTVPENLHDEAEEPECQQREVCNTPLHIIDDTILDSSLQQEELSEELCDSEQYGVNNVQYSVSDRNSECIASDYETIESGAQCDSLDNIQVTVIEQTIEYNDDNEIRVLEVPKNMTVVSNSAFEQFVTERVAPVESDDVPKEQEAETFLIEEPVYGISIQETHSEYSEGEAFIPETAGFIVSNIQSHSEEMYGKRKNDTNSQTYNTYKAPKLAKIQEYETNIQETVYSPNKIECRPAINRVYSKNKPNYTIWDKYLMKYFSFTDGDIRRLDTKVVISQLEGKKHGKDLPEPQQKPSRKKTGIPRSTAPLKSVLSDFSNSTSDSVVGQDLFKIMCQSGASTILERYDYTKSKNQDSQTARARIERRPTMNSKVKFATDVAVASASSPVKRRRGSTVSPDLDILNINLDSLSLSGRSVSNYDKAMYVPSQSSAAPTMYREDTISLNSSPNVTEQAAVPYCNVITDEDIIVADISIPIAQEIDIPPLPAEVPYWDNINNSSNNFSPCDGSALEVKTHDFEIYKNQCYDSPCTSPEHETHLPIKKRRVSSLNVVTKEEIRQEQYIREQKEEEISYPPTPMISIAELENIKTPVIKFKTPAQLKEIPPLTQPITTSYIACTPSHLTPPQSLQHYSRCIGTLHEPPIIQLEKPLNISHTYNNPTINYHIGGSSMVNFSSGYQGPDGTTIAVPSQQYQTMAPGNPVIVNPVVVTGVPQSVQRAAVPQQIQLSQQMQGPQNVQVSQSVQVPQSVQVAQTTQVPMPQNMTVSQSMSAPQSMAPPTVAPSTSNTSHWCQSYYGNVVGNIPQQPVPSTSQETRRRGPRNTRNKETTQPAKRGRKKKV